MMENSLSPAFVRINYASAYGPHVMTVPSVPIVTGINSPSFYDMDLRGAEISHEADDSVKDFVALLRPFFPSSVSFIDYTLFSQPDPDDPATPLYSAALGLAGTNADAGWNKATQHTITWRTDAFGLFKLVLLDVDSGNTFRKTTIPSTYSAALTNLNNYVIAPETWLAGRDGGRPNVFLQMATTLNEKLRRAYKLN